MCVAARRHGALGIDPVLVSLIWCPGDLVRVHDFFFMMMSGITWNLPHIINTSFGALLAVRPHHPGSPLPIRTAKLSGVEFR